MKKSTKTELNRYLKEMNKAELEKEVKKLYTKFSEVKKFYELEFSQDTTTIVNEYKKKIRNEYFPSRGFGKARTSVSKKVITDFKKISIFQKDVIDLLLYRVELMLKFTNNYGDIDEPFYNSLVKSFEEACKLIYEEKLEKEFKHICKELKSGTYDIGWGLYDGLDHYYEYYLAGDDYDD